MTRRPTARSVVRPLRRLLRAAAAAACVLAAREAGAQGGAHVLAGASIELQVTDGETGEPLEGATVHVDGVARAVSDTAGYVLLSGLEPGRHLLDVEMMGRRVVSPEVDVVEGEVLSLEVVLDPETVELPPVGGTARPRTGPGTGGRPGIRGSGRWIGREAIVRSGARRLSELLVMVGAMQPDGRVREAHCLPLVVADGIILSGSTVDVFPVQDLEAVQVFTNGNVPPEFGGSSAGTCGVVAVWTRHK
jgi:hypothetical protein